MHICVVCVPVCVLCVCVCVCIIHTHTHTPPHTDIQPWMYKAPTQTLRKTDTRALPSQATKISKGEIKQEGLLQDAIKFASAMPGLFGGNPSGNSGRAGAAAEAEAIAMGHSSMEPVSLRAGGPHGGRGWGLEGGVGEGSRRLASQTLTEIDHGRNQQLAQQTWSYGQDAADAISEPGRPVADGEEPRQPHQASLRLQRRRVHEARGGGYHPRRMRRRGGGSHQVVYQRQRGGAGGGEGGGAGGGGGHAAASPSWWARVWGFVSARGIGGDRGRGPHTHTTVGPQDGVTHHAKVVDSAAL